jgi:hypothetical protein
MTFLEPRRMVESAPSAVEAKNPATMTNFMVAVVFVGSELCRLSGFLVLVVSSLDQVL